MATHVRLQTHRPVALRGVCRIGGVEGRNRMHEASVDLGSVRAGWAHSLLHMHLRSAVPCWWEVTRTLAGAVQRSHGVSAIQ